jgi:tetratricopeptide (TPR) repeat protein
MMKRFYSLFVLFSVVLFLPAQNVKVTDRVGKMDDQSKKYGYENNGTKCGWWADVDKVKANFLSTSRREDMTNLGYSTEWVIAPQYDKVSKYFSENLAGVMIRNKVGFIDARNRFVISPTFEPTDDLHGFNLGLAAVKKNGKYGFIDQTGKFVIQPTYDYADNFRDNMLATIKMDGKYGAIDLKGNIVVPCKYLLEEAMINVPISNKLYKKAEQQVKLSKDNGDYDAMLAQITTARTQVTKIIRDSMTVLHCKEPLKIKKEAGQYGMTDKDGAWVIPAQYDDLRLLPSDFVQVVKDSLWGIFDLYGRTIIPCKYDYVKYDSKGRVFIVEQKDKFGIYNKCGAMVLPPGLDAIDRYIDGKAIAWMDYETGLVDTKGAITGGLLERVFMKAVDLDKADKKTEAMALYNQILSVKPAYAMAHNNIGIIQIEKENYRVGMDRLKIAHQMDPDNKEITDNLHQAKKDRNERRWNRVLTGLEVLPFQGVNHLYYEPSCLLISWKNLDKEVEN